MENTTGFQKLIVYQKAKLLAIFVYKVTKNFPVNEQHGMISQMRRAIVSVAANIVEGYTKSTTKDFIRYLDISLGSLAEIEFYFELSLELGYIDINIYNKFQDQRLEVARLLRSFQKSLREKSR